MINLIGFKWIPEKQTIRLKTYEKSCFRPMSSHIEILTIISGSEKELILMRCLNVNYEF